MALYGYAGRMLRINLDEGKFSDEHLDTCFSNTSTLEATFGGTRPNLLGFPPVQGQFSPWEVPVINALTNEWHIFEDYLGVCRFNMTVP